jgi:catechol 2,3-dioxygenase-like lactoylglutathione lyase family enzyme
MSLEEAMLSGLNHLTLAVSQLAPSVAFYQQLLGMTLHARWDNGVFFLRRPLAVPVAGPAAARYPAGGERLHPLRVQHCGSGFRAFCRAAECGWRSGVENQ